MKKFSINLNRKQFLRISLRVLILGLFLVSLSFTERRREEMICKEVQINIEDSSGNSFVEREDIEQIIQNKLGKLNGKQLHSINISMLENIINNNPFVRKAEVFSTINGKLIIHVWQRNPVVRIINAFGESYYIDDSGTLMPASDKFSAHVPVANGSIFNKETEHHIRKMTTEMDKDTTFHPTLLEKIYVISDYTRHSYFWNAQIEQIYVNAEGELELILRVGSQTILFGDLESGGTAAVGEKFNKLFLLFREGFSKTGWNQYSSIDLRFKDQVVCKKISNQSTN